LRIIEAMLFVGGAPLTAERVCAAIHGLTPAQFREQIDDLGARYRRQGRPYQIRPQDQGFVLTLKPRFRTIADRLHGSDREARLSQTAIDALALVAYRQPATKKEIDAIRGGDSGSLLRQLLRRGLIAVQRGQADQREITYCTTRRFLELFGLKSLDDLPQTQDLQKI
jgi:segregation and condensation protein B